MNQKKCPKCGELNPQEAVMCWACYTPLAGDGAAAVTAATATARAKAPAAQATHARDEKDDKKAVAPWQIGVIAVALLALGGLGFMLTRGGSSDSDILSAGNSAPFQLPSPGIKGVGPRNSGVMPGVDGGSPSVTMPRQDPGQPTYSITTTPARSNPIAVVGIVPNMSVTDQQAAALALDARKKVMAGQNYQVAFIYVFRDRQSASDFQTFQRSNRGSYLQGDDYVTLSNLWPSTLVRYEYTRGNEEVRYPHTNPSGWWSAESHYTKARD